MLSRSRKAHYPGDQRVVTTVRPLVALGQQLIETVRWTFAPTIGDIEAQRPKARSRHRNHQPRLALTTRRKIDKAFVYELMAREIIRNARHWAILGDR